MDQTRTCPCTECGETCTCAGVEPSDTQCCCGETCTCGSACACGPECRCPTPDAG